MAKYRKTCTQCEYRENFTATFVMTVRDDEKCPECGSVIQCIEDNKIAAGNKTAALVSGVGDINSRLPGDFRDMMQRIKKGSPGSQMKDYR